MVNDYDLLRSVLNIKNNDDKVIAEVLSSMQRDEIEEKNPEANEEEDTYTPENTEGPPPPPFGGEEGSPPGRDEVCARFFLAMNPKDRIPEARMKRTDIYNSAGWINGKVEFKKQSLRKIPEQIDSNKSGYFYKATVNIPKSGYVTIPGISYGDWVSSYTTDPPGIRVDFFINEVGQRYVLSPMDITLTYILGIDKSIGVIMNHGKGSPTEIKGISINDLKNESGYNEAMSFIDGNIESKVKEFLNNDPRPPKNPSDYGSWVKEHWNWFGFNESPSGNPNDPCRYQSDSSVNSMLESGDNVFNAMKMRQGACRYKAAGFFVIATYYGIPCHMIINDCHAFVEIWVPGIGWNMYDLGGCSPPGQDSSDDPLDPNKKFEEHPPSPQKPPSSPPTPKTESSMLSKQIEALAKLARERGVKCDTTKLIEGLWEDVKTNQKKRLW